MVVYHTLSYSITYSKNTSDIYSQNYLVKLCSVMHCAVGYFVKFLVHSNRTYQIRNGKCNDTAGT